MDANSKSGGVIGYVTHGKAAMPTAGIASANVVSSASYGRAGRRLVKRGGKGPNGQKYRNKDQQYRSDLSQQNHILSDWQKAAKDGKKRKNDLIRKKNYTEI